MPRFIFLIPDEGKGPTGGIMNIVRHCALASRLGARAVLATESGRDRHGRYWFTHGLTCIPWSERRPEDTCVIPDVFTDRVAAVAGPCIVYMQSPTWLRRNFDYMRRDLAVWTDSPPMTELCRQAFPGKETVMVPNVVDKEMFPFIPQTQRRPGMMIVFPRKGPEFVRAVFAEYRRKGGRYWTPKVVDGIPLSKLATLFRQAQGFLASAEVEGCALPPQESMAAGVVVAGRDAGGANFCMQHRRTAMVASDPAETADHLCELEDPALREQLTRNAYEFIQRYFPEAEPTRFWQSVLAATPAATAESSGTESPNRPWVGN